MGFSATGELVGDDTYVVSFDGELDFTSAGRLKTLLFDLVASGAQTIAVDLTATVVDTTAAGVLIITDNARRRSGRRLSVRGAEHHGNEALARLVQANEGGENGSGQGSG